MADDTGAIVSYVGLGLFLPALVAFGLVLAVRRSPSGLTGTAIALAFLLSWIAERGTLEVPGSERWHLIAVAVLALGAFTPWLSVLEDRVPDVLAGAVAASIVGVALGKWVSFPGWTPYHAWAMGCAAGVVGLSTEWCALRRPGAAIPFSLAACIGTESVLLAMSGFLSLAVPAGAMALALGAASLVLGRPLHARDQRVTADSPVRTLAGGGALTAVATLTLLGFAGWSYNFSAIQPWMWLLPIAAPAVLLLTEVPGLAALSTRSPTARFAICMVPMTAICVVVLYLAWRAMNDGGGSGA
ncbi:MAG: hypothetical protein O2819_05455 [Planctomycetota bacterium]|nr:hypothetical protein [Planctomycetota bacterium]MDA1106366.1 hypothetical protein [Planctomycetota bacterium]